MHLTASASLAPFVGALPVWGPFLLGGPLVPNATATLDLGGRAALLLPQPGAQLLVWGLVSARTVQRTHTPVPAFISWPCDCRARCRRWLG